jgi:hypothetical protein
MARPIRGRADYLNIGDFNAVCFECGRKRKASYLKKHWQGYYVCPEHWEIRHPQDFVRSVPDNIDPPYQQPPEDTFVYVCSWEGRMAVCDIGTADCMICNYVAPGYADGIAYAPGINAELNVDFVLNQSELE